MTPPSLTQIKKIHFPTSPEFPPPSLQEKKWQWKGADVKATLAVFLLGIVLWFCPVPEGLTPQTWHLFVIFLTTIVAVIIRPLPMGAISLLALAFCLVTKTLTIEQSLSGFSSSIVWLIVLAFIVAKGFVKTGLGERVAYHFISTFGKSSLGLSYSLVTTELFLAPAVPSNTARGAGIIYPIIRSLASGYGSSAEQGTSGKIGAFLVAVCFNANLITSAMFLTGMACNPLVASLSSTAGVSITWFTWAKMAMIPGMISLITMPLILYKFFPPELKSTPEAPEKARQALKERGSIQWDELIMLGTFLILLGLWIFGDSFGIDATSTAIIGISILLFTGILDWKDVIDEKGAWETLIWFSILLMMAGMLTKLGMMSWFAGKMSHLITGFHWANTLIILSLVYFYVHYIFASITAHVMSLFAAFLTLMIATGVPPLMGSMALGICSCLSGCLTHFGTGSAPVYFGSRLLTLRQWWTIGFIMSVVNLIIWGGIGALWWKILGIW